MSTQAVLYCKIQPRTHVLQIKLKKNLKNKNLNIDGQEVLKRNLVCSVPHSFQHRQWLRRGYMLTDTLLQKRKTIFLIFFCTP